MTPEMIKPIIPGIFNLLSRMGDNRMINKINENISTGLPNGNSNSCIKCLKKSVMSLYSFIYSVLKLLNSLGTLAKIQALLVFGSAGAVGQRQMSQMLEALKIKNEFSS